MKKVIRLKESDIQRIVTRVLTEQTTRNPLLEPSAACLSCVEVALGPKYSAKAKKIAVKLTALEFPSMTDIAELLEDCDMADAFIIGPKLLECDSKCMPGSGSYPMDEKIPFPEI